MVSLYNRMVILERRFETEMSPSHEQGFFDRLCEEVAVSRRLAVAPARLGLQRHPLLVSVENLRGRRNVSAYLQKPLTAAIYRVDMDSQFMSMGAARKQHTDYHRRNQGEMQKALKELGAEVKPKFSRDTVRQALILDHFRFLGDVKPAETVLFSLPADSSFAVQSLAHFFSKPERSECQGQPQTVALESDMCEATGHGPLPFFFTLTKAKPSSNKRVYVHPGAGRSLKSHHVAIAFHQVSAVEESGEYTVAAQHLQQGNARDNLAILTSLGKCAAEVESGLKTWSVSPKLSYALPGVSHHVNCALTERVAEGYRVEENGFHVPRFDISAEADALCKRGLLVSNDMGGYALTSLGMKALSVQWQAVTPRDVCAVREGLDVMQL